MNKVCVVHGIPIIDITEYIDNSLINMALNLCPYHKHDCKGFEDDCGYCIDALCKLKAAYELGVRFSQPRC